MDAESRAAAAELRLASIQSNVNQLRVLLDQFQERAVRAGFSQLQAAPPVTSATTATETITRASAGCGYS